MYDMAYVDQIYLCSIKKHVPLDQVDLSVRLLLTKLFCFSRLAHFVTSQVVYMKLTYNNRLCLLCIAAL